MLMHRRQRGDTMIEVLLAVTIFSIVAVTGLTIMNQGSAASQRALEITLVRNEIEAQAATLRHIYDAALVEKSAVGYDPSATAAAGSAVDTWNKIFGTASTDATPFGAMADATRCNIPGLGERTIFVVNPRTGDAYVRTAANYAKWGDAAVFSRIWYHDAAHPDDPLPTNIEGVQGLWIEAVKKEEATVSGHTVPGYTDFHIRACWATVGQSRPATLGTIVRLYEP